MSILVASALSRSASANLVWENEFADEAAIVDGSMLTVANGTTITFGRTVFSDDTGGTFDLDPYRNSDYLTVEHGQTGRHFGYLELSFDNDNDDPDDYVELSLNFDREITDLQFSLLDIDSGSWDDGVEVFYNGSNNVRDNSSILALTGSNVGFDNKSYLHGWEGLGGNTGQGQTHGNIDFDFGSLRITSLRIRFLSTRDASSNPGGQFIGLSDLAFIEAVPEPSSLACMGVLGIVLLSLCGRRQIRQAAHRDIRELRIADVEGETSPARSTVPFTGLRPSREGPSSVAPADEVRWILPFPGAERAPEHVRQAA